MKTTTNKGVIMRNPLCKITLLHFRKVVGAKKNERINKRYKSITGWLAPNDKYYDAHCGHCAEVDFLTDVYDK